MGKSHLHHNFLPWILGVTATVPLQSTTVERFHPLYEYAEANCLHKNHYNIYSDLKIIVLVDVDNTNCFALHNVCRGYMGSSTKDIMNHTMYWYPLITIGQFTTKRCLPHSHQRWITILWRVKHDVHSGTIPTSFISCCKLFWNLHTCVQRLVWKAKRKKIYGQILKHFAR